MSGQMCIRDRSYPHNKLSAASRTSPSSIRLNDWILLCLNVSYTVSYTHLDVYKRQVFELLDAEDQVPEAENAAALQPDGHVRLQDVSFRYLPEMCIRDSHRRHRRHRQR